MKRTKIMPVTMVLVVTLLFVTGCSTFQGLTGGSKDQGVLDSELNQLTNQMVRSLSQEGRRKIAIVPFTNLHGKVPELGKFIAEELIIRMFQTQRFEVVERHQLNRVVEEQHLGMSGLVDEESAAAIGRLLGVQAIVTGTLTDLGDRVRVNARMITTEKAEIFAVATVTVSKQDYIQVMMYRFDDTQVSNYQGFSGTVYEGKVYYPTMLADDFEFTVQSAEKGWDNKITVDIDVKNHHHQTWEIGIKPAKLIFADQEKEYVSSATRLGYAHGDKDSIINQGFNKNQSHRLRYEFNDVEGDLDILPLLSFSANNLRGEIHLRNIPIKK